MGEIQIRSIIIRSVYNILRSFFFFFFSSQITPSKGNSNSITMINSFVNPAASVSKE